MEIVHARNKSFNKNVILKIISGYGFGLIKGQIVIHATLMDINYKTPTIPVNKNDIKIDSEICWSLDINTLRKLKMANTCIRIECFNIPKTDTKSQEKLGYVLLKIKEAQTINPTSNDRIENNSYKLMGSKNNCSYSITLSLRVEDYNNKTIETTPKKNNLKLINNKNIIDYNNLEKVEENTYFVENIEKDLPIININNLNETKQLSENKSQNLLNIDVLQKSIELEEWKDKQIILFNEKMKTKEEQILKEFNKKLIHNKTSIEKELTQAMAKCKELVEYLDNMTDILKEREGVVRAKELELEYQKNSMDNNMQIIKELRNKNIELETKLNRAEQKNIFNEQLKNDINSKNNLQIQQLENTILTLKNNLEEANKSSMYYKERWIICVRKINQMK